MKTWITDLLKKVLGNGFLVLLIVAVLYILWLRECKRPEPCPPKGQVLIAQSVWDSIKALANKPPKVTHDTVWLKGDVVYVPGEPLPKPKPDARDTTINHYADSLVRKDVYAGIGLTIRGTLLDRVWWYRPIQKIVRIDSIIYVPHIVEVIKPVIQAKNGLYIYGMAGGNDKAFLFGGGADFITKKNTEIGAMYQRFGSDNFYSLKFGWKLFPK